jgi:hypothetical protein
MESSLIESHVFGDHLSERLYSVCAIYSNLHLWMKSMQSVNSHWDVVQTRSFTVYPKKVVVLCIGRCGYKESYMMLMPVKGGSFSSILLDLLGVVFLRRLINASGSYRLDAAVLQASDRVSRITRSSEMCNALTAAIRTA